MRTTRLFLSWYFALLALIFLRGTFGKDFHSFPPTDTPGRVLSLIVEELFCLATAFIFGFAWWVGRRDKASARKWGIAASLLDLLISVAVRVFYYFHWGWLPFMDAERISVIPTLLGIVGLTAFVPRHSKESIDRPLAGK
jgi:hypothetical protein